MTKPKTIADLGTQDSKPTPLGRSMVTEKASQASQVSERDKLQARIKRLEEERAKEDAMLEAGGYDYDGREAFAQLMQRVGRM